MPNDPAAKPRKYTIRTTRETFVQNDDGSLGEREGRILVDTEGVPADARMITEEVIERHVTNAGKELRALGIAAAVQKGRMTPQQAEFVEERLGLGTKKKA